MQNDSNKTGKGFTQVEMLIVVLVIVLLVTIAVPAINRAMALADATSCRNNLRAVAVAMRMYLNDSEGVMPRAAQMPSHGRNEDPPIADVLAGSIPHPRLLECPGDNGPNENGKTFFESEGSSYEYQTLLGGTKVSESFLTQESGEADTPVMNDYGPFHGRSGTSGAMNYLFADCHVGDLD